MCLRQMSKRLCAVVLLGALAILSAVPVSAQPLPDAAISAASDETPSIFGLIYEWLFGWPSSNPDRAFSSAGSTGTTTDGTTEDTTTTGGDSTGGETTTTGGDDGSDGGGTLDPWG